MFTFHNLALLLPIAIMLHVTEEFLYPGGFIKWYAEFRPPKTEGVKPGYLVWINALMMGVCVLPLYFGDSANGISFWFCISAATAINACFHILGVFKLKKYSPGVLTGVLLYLPIFAYGSWLFISSGGVTIGNAAIYLGAAVGYHVFSYIRQGQ